MHVHRMLNVGIKFVISSFAFFISSHRFIKDIWKFEIGLGIVFLQDLGVISDVKNEYFK